MTAARLMLYATYWNNAKNKLCSMLYALCSVLYAVCNMLYALCSMLYALCSMLYALCSVLCALCSVLCALCSMHYMALLTIFHGSFLDDFLWLCWQFFCGGFLDDFVDNFLRPLFRRLWWHFFTAFCFALYAVQSLSTQYKSLLHVLRGGGWNWGGGGCVCVKAILWTACCCQKTRRENEGRR
jgi:hypothetical protein